MNKDTKKEDTVLSIYRIFLVIWRKVSKKWRPAITRKSFFG